jgi:hypothetical protein
MSQEDNALLRQLRQFDFGTAFRSEELRRQITLHLRGRTELLGLQTRSPMAITSECNRKSIVALASKCR